jgi:hypothetical protein
MAINKFKLFTVTAVAAAALATATNVLACEQCNTDSQNQAKCWSGYSSGIGACWTSLNSAGKAICPSDLYVNNSCSAPQPPINDVFPIYDGGYDWTWGNGSFWSGWS